MSVVVVVPARGGSKGIPRKNLVDLGGRPLVRWTLDAAVEAGLGTVVLSSDDEEILEVGRSVGVELHHRAGDLARDEVHAVHVVVAVLEQMDGEGRLPETVVMALPTSPFRGPGYLRDAVRLLDDEEPPAVISVCESDKQLIHLREIDDEGRLVPLVGWDSLTAQRQEQPPLFVLNGSVYACRARDLLAWRTFHVPGARAMVMDRRSSIDINEPSDLERARQLLSEVGS